MLVTTLPLALGRRRAPGDVASDSFKRCWIVKTPLVPLWRLDRLPTQRASRTAKSQQRLWILEFANNERMRYIRYNPTQHSRYGDIPHSPAAGNPA
jgi:hypothetical protein